MLNTQRSRDHGLRARRSDRGRRIRRLGGGRGRLRTSLGGGGGRTSTLGHRVRGRVTRRVTHTRTRTGTTHRQTTHTREGHLTHRGTTTSKGGIPRAGPRARPIHRRHITSAGNKCTVAGTRGHLSSSFTDGGKHLPCPISNHRAVITTFNRRRRRRLGCIHAGGDNVSVRATPNASTHTIFGNRIAHIFIIPKCGGSIVIHRNGCLAMCDGLDRICIGTNSGIDAHRTVKGVFASARSNGTAVLRFRL